VSSGAYPPIAEHGVIGNLHTVALIATDGTVDWYCAPRFDSPSMFASLLDAERGGRFVLRPATGEWQNKQLYLPDTNVLITRFLTPNGVGEVKDFMPVGELRGWVPPRSAVSSGAVCARADAVRARKRRSSCTTAIYGLRLSSRRARA
jgi:hypothetical protein